MNYFFTPLAICRRSNGAYVSDACGQDADLKQQLRCLLQVHREAGSFLNAPAPHALTIWAMMSILSLTAYGQMDFESPPIDYAHAPINAPVTRLQKQIDAGQVTLRFDEKHGYLPAVLEQLGIPGSSQMLVASQTSFQLRKISPHRPRAIYFNDNVYVGWVQFGDVMELSSVDPRQGAILYTLDGAGTSDANA